MPYYNTLNTHIVTFDLNFPGQNYEALYQMIHSFPCYAKIATTTYVIKTEYSEERLCNILKTRIDGNDTLVVAKITGEMAWVGLSEKVTAWLKNQLSSIFA